MKNIKINVELQEKQGNDFIADIRLSCLQEVWQAWCESDKVVEFDKWLHDQIHGEVSFDVTTYSLLDKDVKYCHWSEGLNMVIKKNGVTIKLTSEEIQQIVKSLPRTVGGRY